MKGEFSSCAQETINNTKWNIIKGKAVSEKDQDLVDTTEAHKSMAWFELDESAEFGKNDVAKRKKANNKSNSKSEVLHNFVQRSEVSTFATKESKAKIPNNIEGSNDISVFTQVTQGTQRVYEIRIVKIETQIDKFKADIKSHLKESETQRQIQADIQTQKNQENINQL